MQIFNFVVLFAIIALHNVPTSHISITHLPIFHLMYLKSTPWYLKIKLGELKLFQESPDTIERIDSSN